MTPDRLEELLQIAGGIAGEPKSDWMDELIDEIKRLQSDLALNATMLARQCDLAREVETQLAAAQAERDLDWIETLGLQGVASTPAEAAAYIEENWLPRQLAAEKAENTRLREIVEKLPKTADGVPVTPGMRLFGLADGGIREMNAPHIRGPAMWWYSDCHSTREAAETATRPPKEAAQAAEENRT